MKTEMLDFVAQAEQQVTDASLRAKVIATAIAVALATSQHLPSSEVENASAYYNTQVMPAVTRAVSLFNEVIVFDARSAVDQARQLWQLRYASAFGTPILDYNQEGNFFDKFLGINTYISDTLRCHVDAHQKAIISLSQFARGIVASTLQPTQG